MSEITLYLKEEGSCRIVFIEFSAFGMCNMKSENPNSRVEERLSAADGNDCRDDALVCSKCDGRLNAEIQCLQAELRRDGGIPD